MESPPAENNDHLTRDEAEDTQFGKFLTWSRDRAPSAADPEVKLFLPNGYPPESSESESDGSQLEIEFGRSLQRVHSRHSETTVDTKDFWSSMKANLAQQTEQSLLMSPKVDDESPAPSKKKKPHRRRTKSWLEAKERVRQSLEVPSYQDMVKAAQEAELQSDSEWASSSASSLSNTRSMMTSSDLNASMSKAELDSSPSGEQNVHPPESDASLRSEMSASDSSEDETKDQPAPSWWDALKNELEDGETTTTGKEEVENSPPEISPPKVESPKPSPKLRSRPSSSYSTKSPPSQETSPTTSLSRRRSSIADDVVVKSGPGIYRTRRGHLKFDNGAYKGETAITIDQYTLAHGMGTFTSSTGETYTGQWVMGKREGKGIKKWEDGREYVGEWKGNQRNGNGVSTWTNGNVYTGEIAFGFQQGHGMFKTDDGEKYIGEWNVNERHGFGVMYFNNGDVYSGEWRHNKKEGPGVYKYADGKIIQGEWEANQLIDKKAAKKKREKEEKEMRERDRNERKEREKLKSPKLSSRSLKDSNSSPKLKKSQGETSEISPTSSPALSRSTGNVEEQQSAQQLKELREKEQREKEQKEKEQREKQFQEKLQREKELRDKEKKKKSRTFSFGRKSKTSS